MYPSEDGVIMKFFDVAKSSMPVKNLLMVLAHCLKQIMF